MSDLTTQAVGEPLNILQPRRLGVPQILAIGALVAVTLVAVAAPLLAPHDPLTPTGLPLMPPGSKSLLGTDAAGYDILSRCLFGWRSTWFAALGVIAIGLGVGAIVGVAAGATGGVVDYVLMRVTDLFLALPAPVLAIAVVAAFGPSLKNTLIGVAVVWWPYYARIIRSEIKQLAARPHMEAARLARVGTVRLWRRHLLPGAAPTILVAASLDVGGLIVTLAGLSFIGLGAPQPAPELGGMAAAGVPLLLGSAWVPIAPAVAVLILAFVANIAGDALRDLLEDR